MQNTFSMARRNITVLQGLSTSWKMKLVPFGDKGWVMGNAETKWQSLRTLATKRGPKVKSVYKWIKISFICSLQVTGEQNLYHSENSKPKEYIIVCYTTDNAWWQQRWGSNNSYFVPCHQLTTVGRFPKRILVLSINIAKKIEEHITFYFLIMW